MSIDLLAYDSVKPDLSPPDPSELARARTTLNAAKALVDAAEAQCRRENEDLYTALERAKKAEAEADLALRNHALAYYHDSGDKNPSPGVSVAVHQKIGYDDDDAFAFAQRKGMWLTLDRSAFERFVKNETDGASPGRVSVYGLPVEVQEDPRIRISRKLVATNTTAQ